MKIEFEMRVHGDDDPRLNLTREVDWPAVPRAGDFVEVVEGASKTVRDVYWQADGTPLVRLEAWIIRKDEDESVDDLVADGGWQRCPS